MIAGIAPTVSVVVPVRDGASTLLDVLAAIAALSPAPLEVLVADDGSRDGSAALAAARGVRVLPVGGPGGPAAARNAGARAAAGELILFVDADVLVPRDALATVYRRLESSPGLAGVQGVYAAEPSYPTAWTLYQQAYYHHYFCKVYDRTEAVLATYCTAVRREAFEVAGGFDESVGEPTVEDERLGYRFHDLGYRIGLTPELEVRHLAHYTALGFVLRRFRMVRSQARMIRQNARRLANVLGRHGHHPRNVLASVALLPLVLSSPALLWFAPSFTLLPWALFGACHLGFWSFVLERWGSRALAQVAAITLLDSMVIASGGVVGLVHAAPAASKDPQKEPACA